MVKDPVCDMEIEPRHAVAVSEHEGRAYYFCSKKFQDKFLAQPTTFINKADGMRLTIGVMGSADIDQSDNALARAYALGETIAQHSFVLITGACPGLPYECARGVRKAGGLSVGISPAMSLDEHVYKISSPSDVFDVLIYTGNGLMGREVTNIHSSDMVIILGGRSGTLGEFAIAYDESKLIGVLEGIDGITEQIPKIVSSFNKDTGARVIYDTDPAALIDKLSNTYATQHYKRPSCFCDEY